MTGWQPGDRVEVYLPDKHGLKVQPNAHAWFCGTVREVDPPGCPPGVRVDLDENANGVRACYATHAELRGQRAPAYMDNPKACGARAGAAWGYLPCGCENDGLGSHAAHHR